MGRVKTYITGGILFFAITLLSIHIIRVYFKARRLLVLEPFLKGEIIMYLAITLIAYYIVNGLRVHYALKVVNAKPELKVSIAASFINTLFSTITPFAAGGGAFQIYYLTRRRISFGIY